MWHVNSSQILHFQERGRDFTELLDSLVRAEAMLCNVPSSDIRTSLRINIADGGVDTEVLEGSGEVGANDWLRHPTCWQYKSGQYSNIDDSDLIKGINKPYAKELIEKNYAYRLCVCDDFPAQKKQYWEKLLQEQIDNINPSAPSPKVLNASDIATWANKFLGIILRFFRPELQYFLHLDKYGNRCRRRGKTDTFVEIEKWRPIGERLLDHIDFSQSCTDIVLSLQGVAGVGKTRFVYEVLHTRKELSGYVVYSDDEEKVKELTTYLENSDFKKAIIVADECSLETRTNLNFKLKSYNDRLRIIAIDNTGRKTATESEELCLDKLTNEEVERILAENFPEVDPNSRRAYVERSEGFVRLASDLCENHERIQEFGLSGASLRNINEYLEMRLSKQEKEAIYALSLVKKVGFKKEVREELEDLCNFANLESHSVREILAKIKDTSGFVMQAGRYYYVTPEIVATVAFEEGWRKWIQEEPDYHLGRFPDSLLESFLSRTQNIESEEVSRVVGGFFRDWIEGLSGEDLVRANLVKRISLLVNTYPDKYLPKLKKIIEGAKEEVLFKIEGRTNRAGEWGPRRKLVWLCEALAAFPEYFFQAESILFRLALHETELTISNNSTGVWKQLFKIYLSGVSVPFKERFKILRERIFSEEEKDRKLAVQALESAIETRGYRMLGKPVVAGRIPPEEWQPGNRKEHLECVEFLANLVLDMVKSDFQDLNQFGRKTARENISKFLNGGFLKHLKTIFDSKEISDDLKYEVISSVEYYFEYHKDDGMPEDYRNKISDWVESLRSKGPHGKLLEMVSKDHWHYPKEEQREKWRRELTVLSKKLYVNEELFEKEIDWLHTSKAKSSHILGYEIGTLDEEANYLKLICDKVEKAKVTSFARGYISGLLEAYPEYKDRINQWIDKVEEIDPQLAYELFMAVPEQAEALERTLDFIRLDKLTPRYLNSFYYGIGKRLLSKEELLKVFTELKALEGEEEENAVSTALKIVWGHSYKSVKEDGFSPYLEDERILAILWLFLKKFAELDVELSEWKKILNYLLKIDRQKVIQITTDVLIGKGYRKKKEAEEFLIEISKDSPNAVMFSIGEKMLDEDTRGNFFFKKYDQLFAHLPFEVVTSWLTDAGAKGAQAIARHLPKPFVNNKGEPKLPELTEFVLTEFEEDEQTFKEFCAGVHSHEWMSGDIAEIYRKGAQVAKQFLSHDLKRLREWADQEVEYAEERARQWQQRTEERDL